jgi:predicted amidohydrolase
MGVANAHSCVQIFLLPEMFATGFPATKEQAEPPLLADGSNQYAKIQLWMKRVARELNAVVAGSVAVRENEVAAETTTEANKAIYNRLIWMRPTGEYFTYDKKHLFGAEKEAYQQGNQIITIQEQGWNFRLNICYDLRFPVWCKNRRLYGNTLDYDVIIFPSSWPTPRINIWKTLLPARAAENLAYSIGINRSGKDINGTRYSGQSIVSDPQGNIIAQLDEKPQAITVTLNKERLERLRMHLTVAQDWDEYQLKQ